MNHIGIADAFMTLPSGVRYRDDVIGEGSSPTAGDILRVHYTGWLDDAGRTGRKFDSSYDRNRPFSFSLGCHQVIAGWDVGVVGMRVGGTRTLVIPPDMAYGARGAGGVIPPYATLIFEVDLIGVD